MDISDLKRQEAELYCKLDDINEQIAMECIKEVIRLARKILNEHSRLNEFIMAMGTCFFTDKQTNNVINIDCYSYMQPIKKLIDKYDSQYHITGYPIRFTAKGENVHDW